MQSVNPAHILEEHLLGPSIGDQVVRRHQEDVVVIADTTELDTKSGPRSSWNGIAQDARAHSTMWVSERVDRSGRR